MLEPILQQVGAGNPQLAQLIGQNPDQFLQLLSEDADGDAPLPPGAQEISVTEEERAAIERVSAFLPVRPSYAILMMSDSYASWDSSATSSSRHTSHATRTKSWRPTSCSTSLTTAMRTEQALLLLRSLFRPLFFPEKVAVAACSYLVSSK